MDPVVALPLILKAPSAFKMALQLTGVIESVEKKLDRLDAKIEHQNAAHLNAAQEHIRQAALSKKNANSLLSDARSDLTRSLHFEEGARRALALFLLAAIYKQNGETKLVEDMLSQILEINPLKETKEGKLKAVAKGMAKGFGEGLLLGPVAWVALGATHAYSSSKPEMLRYDFEELRIFQNCALEYLGMDERV